MNKPSNPNNVGMQSSDFTLESEMMMWWTTPILRRPCVGSEDVNKGLKALIKEKMETGLGAKKSNVGGWHSEEDLLTWGGPAVATLQQWIVEGFQDLTKVISNGQEYQGKLELNAWANVNRFGDYNSLHTHPACVWSGVYYVDAGTKPEGSNQRAGALEFVDPRAGAEMMAMPGEFFGRAVLEVPKTGDIVMFPSWMKHAVNPYSGEGDRISVAFNIRVRPHL